jgi:uncharacterized protein (DUF488 family)
MASKVFSLGYEMRTITEFIAELRKNNISVLVDVRESPWSYKLDFRKKTLDAALSKVGIIYKHIPEAGNPKKIRTSYVKPETVLRKYAEYLEKTESGMSEIKEILTSAKKANENICLICYERDHECCHRSVILDKLKTEFPRLSITHL